MGPFVDAARPVVMGHRGAPVVAPENTPAAFAAAADAGATWVELDARRSADGAVVVHHDPWVGGDQAVVELACGELRARGVWLLADVLARLPPGLGVDVELKNLPGEPDYDEGDALVALVADVLAGADRPLMTSSFNPETVAALRSRLPDVPAGLLVTDGVRVSAGVALAVELGACVYCPSADTPGLTDAGVATAHDAGLDVLAWTIDDPVFARALATAGVDALCTNDPGGIADAFRSDNGRG